MAIKVKDAVLQVRIELDLLVNFSELADSQGMTSAGLARRMIRDQVNYFNECKAKKALFEKGVKK
jgi:hypothetical protein